MPADKSGDDEGVLFTPHSSQQSNHTNDGEQSTGDTTAAIRSQDARNFTELLKASGSDKWWMHHYERYYERWLAPLRAVQGIRLLEIGVESGHSMRFWSKFFTNADHVYGIGYKNWQKEKKEEYHGATIYRGDQGDQDFLRYVANDTGGSFDFVLDDGSHLPSHQLITFDELWPHVKYGGMYIIEDIETSFWHPNASLYGYKWRGQKPFFHEFAKLPFIVNRKFSGIGARAGFRNFTDIEAVEFGPWVIAACALFYRRRCSDSHCTCRIRCAGQNVICCWKTRKENRDILSKRKYGGRMKRQGGKKSQGRLSNDLAERLEQLTRPNQNGFAGR